MCFSKNKKNKREETPLPRLDRDVYYGEMTKNISNYSKRIFVLKIIFQWVFGVLSVLLIVGLTVFYILIIISVLSKESKDILSEQTIITTIITSSSAYAVSVLGTLGVVLNYMFNKNDVNDNNELVKSFLDHDNNTPNSIGSKAINELSLQSGMTEMLSGSSDETEGDENEQLWLFIWEKKNWRNE